MMETEDNSNVVTLPTPTAAEVARRFRWHRDVATNEAVRTDREDGSEERYSLTALPFVTVDSLMFLGFSIVVGRSDDRQKAYDALVSGNPPKRANAAAKEPKIDNWRLAIAHALVDATKKTPEPLTLDAAKAKAGALHKEHVRSAKTDPNVVKHYNRLSGVAGNAIIASFLA